MKLLLGLVFAVSICLTLAHQIDFATKPVLDVTCDIPETKRYSRIGQKYYFLGETKITWLESAHLCRRYGAGLAEIESAEEMKDISSYLQNQGNEKYTFWISGYRKQEFVSIYSGLPLQYTSWINGKPDYPRNEECVFLLFREGSFRMSTSDCTNRQLYLCQQQNGTHCRPN